MKSFIKKLILNHYIKRGLKCESDLRLMGVPQFGSEPYLIQIGKQVTISKNVQFINYDGGTYIFRNDDDFKDIIKFGEIKIKDNCFIGANSIIMPGVTIGTNCVIGAGSIVTKSIPDNSVAVGVPAKVIMTTEEYKKKCINNNIKYDVLNYKNNKRAELERIFMN